MCSLGQPDYMGRVVDCASGFRIVSECAPRGGKSEDGVEHRPHFPELQDPGPDEVVEGHSQGHLLSAQDPLESNPHVPHKELVCISRMSS